MHMLLQEGQEHLFVGWPPAGAQGRCTYQPDLPVGTGGSINTAVTGRTAATLYISNHVCLSLLQAPC